jgi:anaerobic magnesium-protoporphyrin IX monomethyl ester cyclase
VSVRVLLISPWYDTHIVAPHLGLGYVAAALRRAGHSVTVLDGLREKVVYDARQFDLCGVTAMSTYFPEAVVEVKKAKARGLPVVIGGAHVIATPRSSLEQSGADYAVTGEGEIPIVRLANGDPPADIQGLAWRDGGEIRQNAGQPFVPDIDAFGEPAWDLIAPRSYPIAPHGMIARSFPLAPIITTRGCPYRCTYCSAPVTAGTKMRYRKPEAVVDEIELLVKKYGVREVQIEDDNFTFKREHAWLVAEEILRRKIRVHWSLPNGVRIDRIDPELLRLMKRSGCYLMALGIESANERVLRLVRKGLDLRIVRQAVADVAASGIEAWGFFMIGFPTETREEIQNTIDFALSLPLTRVQFTKTTPLPGTPIYDLWLEKYSDGKQIDWSTFNYYAFQPNWSAISAEEIADMQRRAHRSFYFKPANFWNVVKRLRPEQFPYLIKRVSNLGLFRHDVRGELATADR